MVLEDMIVRGLRATEKMTWLDAYKQAARTPDKKHKAKLAARASLR